MDPLSISPSWPEHLERLHPGLGFADFYSEDNASPDRDFLQITKTNLERVLQLPYGQFASMLSFDDSLISFLDSFLKLRERMNLNAELFPLDRLVVSLFHRFVMGFPSNLNFTPGSKATSLLQLHVCKLDRWIRLVNLYHQPGREFSLMQELLCKWISLFPQVKRELLTKWSTVLLPAAWRGLAEILQLELDLKVLSLHFNQVSVSASDRSNLLACAMHFAKQTRSNFQLVLSSNFAEHLLVNAEFQQLAKDFKTELPPSLPLSKDLLVKMDYDEQQIFYQELGNEQEGGGDEEEDLVSQLKDIYPHLGRYFCQRLLEHCNFSLEQCVQRVMEGDLPTELLLLDFSAEEEEEEGPPILDTVRRPVKAQERLKVASTRLQAADGDLKSKLVEMYSQALYNDEYDDSMEDGTTGEGGKFKQQEEEEEGDGERPKQPVAVLGAARAQKKPSTKPEFRPMIELVEQSVVDVNGERRNAQGKLVAEDTLMRANTNRERAFKPTAAAVGPVKASETEEQAAQRIKRERAKKTQQGSRERRQGDDKKKTKNGL
ncbi:hypothetical protein BASA81_008836 [Batrachochytrium salamandrivorans]|nr:hypothetical protein BASA81_008836 [Batrachochytrium salamandrivorans]